MVTGMIDAEEMGLAMNALGNITSYTILITVELPEFFSVGGEKTAPPQVSESEAAAEARVSTSDACASALARDRLNSSA